ncbi:DUF6894 family protein [Bradyrhizobium diazoefficiens]|uniref:DUF6894 family protein n=1 Tax=Bradyrhizobium diazoefficiens TaxID=1355477 RepID=UPI00289767AC|nr:hypothetical protein [Bradyrhizobium diazoefficiens]
MNLRFCAEFKEMDVPRYHFDLVDSKTVADEGGSELPDDIAALDVAEEIARRLLVERPELRNRHFSILVTNQEGQEIGKVPLDVLH